MRMLGPYEKVPKPRYLPEVTQSAVSAVGAEIQRFGWAAYRTDALFVMKSANGHLIDTVQGFLTGTGMATTDPELDASSTSMIMTHQMLAGQAKIDSGGQDSSEYRLPVVQPEIADAFKADVRELGAVAVGVGGMDKLSGENGYLESMVAQFLQVSGVDGQPLRAAHAAMQMTYMLLDRQAEADVMNNGIFGPAAGQ